VKVDPVIVTEPLFWLSMAPPWPPSPS
jgi:hypothetical protein